MPKVRLTTLDMYKAFVVQHGSLITYKQFKAVINDHNKMVIDGCLEGKTYQIGHDLGELRVGKFDKIWKVDDDGNLANRKVNFNETKKLRAQGDTETVIYHTEDNIYRWYWNKNHCNHLTHRAVWRFSPTKGPLGISRKLAKVAKSNPHAKIIFKPINNKANG